MPTPETPPLSRSRGEDLLHALNLAAASLQRSARSEQAVWQAFSEQISSLQLFGGVAWLDASRQQLTVSSAAFTGHERLRQRLTRLSGQQTVEYHFPVAQIAIYRQVIESGQSAFVADNSLVLAQILGGKTRRFNAALRKTMGQMPAIYTAFNLEGVVSGILGISGRRLTETDAPALEAFANHIAIAVENARLFAAMQQAETQYRLLFDAASDGFLLVDAETAAILSANRKAAEITGYSEAELRGIRMGQLAPSEYAAQARAFFSGLRKSGSGVIEIPFIHRQGHTRLIECTASAYEANGRWLIHGLLRDITERKGADLALAESEARFRALTESTASAIFICQDDRLAYVNAEMEQITAYSRAELLSMRLSDLIHPDFRAEFTRSGLTGASGEAQAAHVEFKIVAKTGAEKWLDYTGRPVEFGGKASILGTAFDTTRNKQIEEDLRMIKVFNEDIVQATSEGILIEDANGCFTFVNPAAADMLGYSVAEMIGIHWTTIVPPEQSALVHEVDRQRRLGISSRYDLVVLRKDGARVPVQVGGRPRFDAQGHFLGVYVVFTDISDRKRIENELRRLKEFNEGIIQNAVEGIGVGDENGYFIFVNPAMARMLGYTPDELVGSHFLDTVPADQHAVILAADDRRRLGGADRYELDLQRKDGTRVTVLVSGTPRYEGGKFAGSLVVFTDISERKTAENALRESEYKFRRIIEQSTDGIMLVSADGVVIEWNQGLAAISGISRQQALGRPFWELQLQVSPPWVQPASDEKQSRDFLSNLLQQGDPRSAAVLREHEIALPDGQRRLIQAVTFPIQTGGGYVAGSIIRDVTGQRQLEQTLRRRAEELAALHIVSLDISASLDLPTVLKTIIERAVHLLDASSGGSLYLCDPEQQEARIVVCYRTVRDYTGMRLKFGEGASGRAAQTGKPVIVDDYQHWEGRSDAFEGDALTALMAVPLLWNDQSVGVITIMDERQNRVFSDADLELLTLFASQAVVAIENARLLEAERAAHEQAETLRDVARAMSGSLELAQVLRLILEQLKRVLVFDTASVLLLGEQSHPALVAVIGYDDEELVSKAAGELLAESPIVTELYQTRRPLILDDVRAHPGWIWVPGAEHVRSFLAVPIIFNQRMIGALMADNRQVRFFTEGHARAAQSLAQHMALAIENARLFEAAEQRAKELEAVRKATLSLTASLELEAVLNAILESALRFIPGAQNAHIFLYNPAEQTLSFGAALYADGRRGAPVAYPRQDGLTYAVARSGQPLVVDDMTTHPLYAEVASAQQWTGSIAGLPLKIGLRVVGVMNISHPAPAAFSAADLRVLHLLGDQAAIAIENAHLFEQAATERRHLRLLIDLSREVAASLDPVGILQRAISLTCQALGGFIGEAFLYEPRSKRLRLCALFGAGEQDISEKDRIMDLTPGKGLAGWSALQRQLVNVPDVLAEPRWLTIPNLDERVRSALTAPIVESNRLLGVLSVLHHQPAAFTSDHADLLTAICRQAALALGNAERYLQVESLVDLLAAEQQRLESLVERLPVGVLLLDSDQRVLIANSSAKTILAALGDVHPQNVLTHLGPTPLADLLSHHADPLPVEIVTAGEERVIVEALARPLGSDARQWILTVRDVTRERENQARIQMQERLATVGQLAAGIAHDFNNIMAAILVYTDLLMSDRGIAPASRDRLEIIQQQVQRAASLIRQILDFSRRSVMEQSRLNLIPFIKELEKLLARVLPENIQISTAVTPDSYIVHADPTRLQQALMNLALNARDAMPAGGKLSFRLYPVSLLPGQTSPSPELFPGRWACLTITDTGVGIAPDILPHVFEPFFTTKPVGKGTGLGLSQVYGIVKQHNGFIDVDSEPGAGTQFAIYLPILPSEPEFPPADTVTHRLDGRGQTVLVVEDDATTREALHAMLTTFNFWVLTASHGSDALQILGQAGDRVEIVITDVVMPEMGGVELYRAIEARWPRIKTLFITGHPLEAESQALLETGRVHWLQKPFSVSEFVNALRALFPDH